MSEARREAALNQAGSCKLVAESFMRKFFDN